MVKCETETDMKEFCMFKCVKTIASFRGKRSKRMNQNGNRRNSPLTPQHMHRLARLLLKIREPRF